MSPRDSSGHKHRLLPRRFTALVLGNEMAVPRTLSTASNFDNPDAAYRMIVEAHRGLSDGDSAALDAALVLLLANHIGDLTVLKQALEQAAQTLPGKAGDAQ
jgi:Protein of unknown function (DUF2783)